MTIYFVFVDEYVSEQSKIGAKVAKILSRVVSSTLFFVQDWNFEALI